MLGGKFLFFGLVFDVLLFYVVGSHFRGGIITWKPDPVVARKVELKRRHVALFSHAAWDAS